MKINKKVIIISVSVLAVLAIGIATVGIIVGNTWKTARTITVDGVTYSMPGYTKADAKEMELDSELLAFYNKYGVDGIQYKIQGDKIIIRRLDAITARFDWESNLIYNKTKNTVLVLSINEPGWYYYRSDGWVRFDENIDHLSSLYGIGTYREDTGYRLTEYSIVEYTIYYSSLVIQEK